MTRRSLGFVSDHCQPTAFDGPCESPRRGKKRRRYSRTPWGEAEPPVAAESYERPVLKVSVKEVLNLAKQRVSNTPATSTGR